jgi:hypothetical protein
MSGETTGESDGASTLSSMVIGAVGVPFSATYIVSIDGPGDERLPGANVGAIPLSLTYMAPTDGGGEDTGEFPEVDDGDRPLSPIYMVSMDGSSGAVGSPTNSIVGEFGMMLSARPISVAGDKFSPTYITSIDGSGDVSPSDGVPVSFSGFSPTYITLIDGLNVVLPTSVSGLSPTYIISEDGSKVVLPTSVSGLSPEDTTCTEGSREGEPPLLSKSLSSCPPWCQISDDSSTTSDGAFV